MMPERSARRGQSFRRDRGAKAVSRACQRGGSGRRGCFPAGGWHQRSKGSIGSSPSVGQSEYELEGCAIRLCREQEEPTRISSWVEGYLQGSNGGSEQRQKGTLRENKEGFPESLSRSMYIELNQRMLYVYVAEKLKSHSMTCLKRRKLGDPPVCLASVRACSLKCAECSLLASLFPSYRNAPNFTTPTTNNN